MFPSAAAVPLISIGTVDIKYIIVKVKPCMSGLGQGQSKLANYLDWRGAGSPVPTPVPWDHSKSSVFRPQKLRRPTEETR